MSLCCCVATGVVRRYVSRRAAALTAYAQHLSCAPSRTVRSVTGIIRYWHLNSHLESDTYSVRFFNVLFSPSERALNFNFVCSNFDGDVNEIE